MAILKAKYSEAWSAIWPVHDRSWTGHMADQASEYFAFKIAILFKLSNYNSLISEISYFKFLSRQNLDFFRKKKYIGDLKFFWGTDVFSSWPVIDRSMTGQLEKTSVPQKNFKSPIYFFFRKKSRFCLDRNLKYDISEIKEL